MLAAFMTSVPIQHEPGHVLALAMFRSSSMEAASGADTHVSLRIGHCGNHDGLHSDAVSARL